MTDRQSEILDFLMDKKSYPHKVSNISIKETHISWVFLTGPYAYKIKKALKFGKILDFSTLELRKKYCLREFTLNRILCYDMYLGVVKIVKRGGFHLVNLNSYGRALEYAVKMVEFPQKYQMNNLLHDNRISTKEIDKLTDILVRFHKSAPTNSRIDSYGRPSMMMKIVNENFDTLTSLGHARSDLRKKIVEYIVENETLFLKRIREGRVRDIHGDLNLQNIFLVRGRFYLYDRIEFNDILRYGDVAHDVAHLSMDLDFYKRRDLSRRFISEYILRSNDYDLNKLVYFLMCLKSSVRAKVSAFKAKYEVDERKKRLHANEFKQRIRLAESYLSLF